MGLVASVAGHTGDWKRGHWVGLQPGSAIYRGMMVRSGCLERSRIGHCRPKQCAGKAGKIQCTLEDPRETQPCTFGCTMRSADILAASLRCLIMVLNQWELLGLAAAVTAKAMQVALKSATSLAGMAGSGNLAHCFGHWSHP